MVSHGYLDTQQNLGSNPTESGLLPPPPSLPTTRKLGAGEGGAGGRKASQAAREAAQVRPGMVSGSEHLESRFMWQG